MKCRTVSYRGSDKMERILYVAAVDAQDLYYFFQYNE